MLTKVCFQSYKHVSFWRLIFWFLFRNMSGCSMLHVLHSDLFHMWNSTTQKFVICFVWQWEGKNMIGHVFYKESSCSGIWHCIPWYNRASSSPLYVLGTKCRVLLGWPFHLQGRKNKIHESFIRGHLLRTSNWEVNWIKGSRKLSEISVLRVVFWL